jgi:hypothetical protein
VQNRVANLLRQWQFLVTPPFTADGDASVPPVDIGEPELSDLACAQPEPSEQKKDRLVS